MRVMQYCVPVLLVYLGLLPHVQAWHVVVQWHMPIPVPIRLCCRSHYSVMCGLQLPMLAVCGQPIHMHVMHRWVLAEQQMLNIVPSRLLLIEYQPTLPALLIGLYPLRHLLHFLPILHSHLLSIQLSLPTLLPTHLLFLVPVHLQHHHLFALLWPVLHLPQLNLLPKL